MVLMPLRKRHGGIVVEARVFGTALDRDPGRLGADHAVHVLGRNWEWGVDRASVRVHKFGPSWVPGPQRASAMRAEVPACAAQTRAGVPLVGKLSLVDAQGSLARHLHASRHSTKVDRVAACTRGLPTN